MAASFWRLSVFVWGFVGWGGLMAPALAGGVPLDPAFVEYLEQFADGKGDVFDAAALDTPVRLESEPNASSKKAEPKKVSEVNRNKEISR